MIRLLEQSLDPSFPYFDITTCVCAKVVGVYVAVFPFKKQWTNLLGKIHPSILQANEPLYIHLKPVFDDFDRNSLVIFSQKSLQDVILAIESIFDNVIFIDLVKPDDSFLVEWTWNLTQNSNHDFSNFCTAILTFFSRCRFPKKNDETRKLILNLILELQGFQRLSTFWKAVDHEHIDFVTIREVVIDILKKSLDGGKNEKLGRILFMSDHISLNDLLGSEELIQSITQYTLRLCNSRLVGVIIDLIDKVFRVLIYVGDVSPAGILEYICLAVKALCSNKHKCRQFLILLGRNPELFEVRSETTNISHTEKIAEHVATVYQLDCDDDINNFFSIMNEEGGLNKAIINAMITKISDYFIKDMKIATTLYHGLLEQGKNKSLLERCMKQAFCDWHINDISAVLCLEEKGLLVLETFYNEHKEDVSILKTGKHIGSIVKRIRESIEIQNCSLKKIHEIDCAFTENSWNAIETMSSQSMIPKSQLEKVLHTARETVSNLQKIIHIHNPDSTLTDLFLYYNCVVDFSTGIGAVLQRCEDIVKYPYCHSQSYIDQNYKKLSDFVEKYQDSIEAASYFREEKCPLFYKKISFEDLKGIDIEEMMKEIAHALVSLRSLFLCDDFDSFSKLKDLTGGRCDRESFLLEMRERGKEIESLVGCSNLGVGTKQKHLPPTLFSLAALFDPLTACLDYCDKIDFRVVSVDKSFQELKSIQKELENALNGVGKIDAEKLAEKTIRICPIPENKQTQWLSLLDCANFFLLFNDFKKTVDLLQFVSGAGWEGRSGLQRFSKEYSNVTNTLQGAPNSFEANILVSLDPVVRLLSCIIDLRKEVPLKCFLSTIFEFIHSSGSKIDIGTAMSAVHQNLSVIKDLFDEKIDDLAMIHSKFQSIWESGKFTFQHGSLTLSYEFNNSPAKVSKDDDLDVLVQQLGFVQHETGASSHRISKFVEDLQMLRESTIIRVESFQLGYGIDYKFDVDVKGLSGHSNEILEESKAFYKEGLQWRENLEKRFPTLTLLTKHDLETLTKVIRNWIDNETMEENLLTTLRYLPEAKSGYNEIMGTARHCRVEVLKDPNLLSMPLVHLCAHFIQLYFQKLGALPTKLTESPSKLSFVLHTCECDWIEQHTFTLQVMKSIYKVRG